MDFKDKKVLVFGSGISGIGACELLEKSGATVILFDGNETNKEIIFLDNHKISEFDSIIFIYGLCTAQGYTTILEKEYRKSTWEYAIQKGNKNVSYVL